MEGYKRQYDGELIVEILHLLYLLTDHNMLYSFHIVLFYELLCWLAQMLIIPCKCCNMLQKKLLSYGFRLSQIAEISSLIHSSYHITLLNFNIARKGLIHIHMIDTSTSFVLRLNSNTSISYYADHLTIPIWILDVINVN